MSAEREGLANLLLAHRGWAETGPNDNGSWNLVCHTCGAHLLTMWGTYVSEEDRDELQAGHVADALADLLAAWERRVRGEALREAAEALDVRWYLKEAEMPDSHETSCWLDGHESAEEFIRDRADRIEADA